MEVAKNTGCDYLVLSPRAEADAGGVVQADVEAGVTALVRHKVLPLDMNAELSDI